MSFWKRALRSAGAIALVFGLAFLLTLPLMVPVIALALLQVDWSSPSWLAQGWNHPIFVYGSTIAQAVGFVAASLLVHGRLQKQEMWSLGWMNGARSRISSLAKGCLMGCLMLLAVLIAMSASGAVLRFQDAGQAWETVCWQLGLLAVVTVNEEVYVQGFAQGLLRQRLGLGASIFGAVLLFTVMHAMNPGVFSQGGLPLWNTALFGLLLALCREGSNGLWLPVGLHWAWYVGQGSVFGFPVSGTAVPSLWLPELGHSTLLTGGAFGADGSLLSTFVIAAAIVASAWRKKRSRPAAAAWAKRNAKQEL